MSISQLNPEDSTETKSSLALKTILTDIEEEKNIQIKEITYINKNLGFLPDISSLTSLQELWLNRNQITSIQSLPQIKMPHIKKLSFSYNKIVKIKMMRKAICPKLDQLQLDHNLIIEEDKFAQGLYNKSTDVWIYFGQKGLEKRHLNKCLRKKIRQIQLKQ